MGGGRIGSQDDHQLCVRCWVLSVECCVAAWLPCCAHSDQIPLVIPLYFCGGGPRCAATAYYIRVSKLGAIAPELGTIAAPWLRVRWLGLGARQGPGGLATARGCVLLHYPYYKQIVDHKLLPHKPPSNVIPVLIVVPLCVLCRALSAEALDARPSTQIAV